MDTTLASLFLLETHSESAWVAALALQRVQLDYFLRGAYFCRVASEKEVHRFNRNGKMPKRADVSGKKRDIYLMEIAREVSIHCGFGSKLESMVHGHWHPLSAIVHGGKELVAIYCHKGEMGDISVDVSELHPIVNNEVVIVLLGLALAMTLSSLSERDVSEIVSAAYRDATAFFSE